MSSINKLHESLKIPDFFFAVMIATSCQQKDPNSHEGMDSVLLLNHTGYHTDDPKKIVFQTLGESAPGSFEVLDLNNQVVYKDKFSEGGIIDNWHTGKAFSGDFTKLNEEGTYRIATEYKGTTVYSREFTIDSKDLMDKSLALLIEGIESQHTAGEFNEKDKAMTFFGDRKDTVDVSGGWYDASGDRGKYLSHLCYSNYFNPQQTPMIVWNLLESANQYQKNKPSIDQSLKQRMLDEAIYGADFLMRMQDPAGYFYTNVFGNWSWDTEKRFICAYQGQDGVKSDEYQAGFREGGGMAIAALARASQETKFGEYDSEQYLEAAEKGFSHLFNFNTQYIDDGKENIIDDYCALLAATELYDATRNPAYLEYSRFRAEKLIGRISSDDNFEGWWSANDDMSRPFFHGVEAGLPIIALSRYLDIETSEVLSTLTIHAIRKAVNFELAITKSVNNPFGYPRQYVKAVDEENFRAAFFIPHNNETGYWWQGENSRLSSLASAFNLSMKYMSDDQIEQAKKYIADCNNWLLGLNPYDVSMVQGLGYNNPEYKENVNLNFRGGVANGITAGFTDETDIAFMPQPQNEDPAQKWRWAEQWMPHAAWFILAVTTAK